MTKQYGTAGARSMSPDCCTSEKLAACSLEAQLLWDRLIITSDDQGRQLGSPSTVKAACFPLLVDDITDRRVRGWLDQLAMAGLVRLYPVKGRQVVQVEKWWEYQNWMRRAYPSKWPAPPGWKDVVRGVSAPHDDGDSPADVPQDASDSPDPKPKPLFLPEPEPVPEPLTDPAAVAAAPPGKPSRKPSGAVQETLSWFAERYAALRGSPYPIASKDAVALTRLLKTFPAEEIRVRLERGLTADDDWLDKTDRGIAVLAGQINKPLLRGIAPTGSNGPAGTHVSRSLDTIARVGARLEAEEKPGER